MSLSDHHLCLHRPLPLSQPHHGKRRVRPAIAAAAERSEGSSHQFENICAVVPVHRSHGNGLRTCHVFPLLLEACSHPIILAVLRLSEVFCWILRLQRSRTCILQHRWPVCLLCHAGHSSTRQYTFDPQQAPIHPPSRPDQEEETQSLAPPLRHHICLNRHLRYRGAWHPKPFRDRQCANRTLVSSNPFGTRNSSHG